MVAGSNPALDTKVAHDTNSELSTLTPVHPTMLCKIDYQRSSIKAFSNDPSKFYLDLVFVPKVLNLLAQTELGTNAEYRLQFFPQRDRATNQVNEVHMNQLIAAFKAQNFGDIMVERFEIAIKPCYFTYTMDVPSAGITKGSIVLDATTGQPKVYSSVQITSLSKMVDGKEVPLVAMSVLESRANRLREQRIKEGVWREITAPTQPSATLAAQQAAEALASASASDVLPY